MGVFRFGLARGLLAVEVRGHGRRSDNLPTTGNETSSFPRANTTVCRNMCVGSRPNPPPTLGLALHTLIIDP